MTAGSGDAPGEPPPALAMPAGYGTATATSVVVASMVGVGVLTTSGYTVAAVGSNQLMLILWVIGGLVAVCGALCLAELSAALPSTGGDYVYMTAAYGPLAGFLSGWVSFLIGFAAPIAATATASTKYLLAPLGLAEPTATLAGRGLATALILVLAAIHTAGRHHSARWQSAITGFKAVVLATLLVAGLVAGRGFGANLEDRPPLDFATLRNMAYALVFIGYAYTGWNAASYLAGEVADPSRTLPRAILLGTGLVVALYLGLNLVYALALPAAEVQALAKTGDDAVAPIAELAARKLFGARVAEPLSVAVGLTLLASLSAYLLTGPRVLYAMAVAGQFPPVLARLTPKGQTPGVATAALVAWALVLLWTGSLGGIVVYAGVGLALFSMLTVGAVPVLRWTRPELARPFRTPGYPLTPLVYLVVSAVLVVAVATSPMSRWDALFSLLSILAGVPVYYLTGLGRGNRPATGGPSRGVGA